MQSSLNLVESVDRSISLD